MLTMDEGHVKAKYRLAKAQIRLNRTLVALEVAQSLVATSPDNADFASLLALCEIGVKEANGEYDLPTMRKEAMTGAIGFHSDLVSDKVALGLSITLPSGLSYRGCKAVCDIEENELLCASKAFAFARGGDEHKFELDLYNRRVGISNDMELVRQIVALLRDRPALGEGLYHLSAGPDFENLAQEDESKINLPRIRAITSNSAFGASGGSGDLEEVMSEWDVIKESHSLEEQMKRAASKEKRHGSGLWLKESMFNHSCSPNCVWRCIGDHMFVTSIKPISEGDELFISYVPEVMSYDETTLLFSNWMGKGNGFQCHCARCTTMRADAEIFRITTAVEEAHENASKMVSVSNAPMWKAAERVLPYKNQLRLLKGFQQYPLHLQHSAGAQLRELHGTCLNHRGDYTGALVMYEEAMQIRYCVRGSCGIQGAKDLWRIAGAALACQEESKARHALETIWNGSIFTAFPDATDARDAFCGLSVKYALPWMVKDSVYNQHEHAKLSGLINQVVRRKSKTNQNKVKGRRKHRR